MNETCRHCDRDITRDQEGRWIDPEATGDDIVWRETCDAHDTFDATHEPAAYRARVEQDDDQDGPDHDGQGYVFVTDPGAGMRSWSAREVHRDSGDTAPTFDLDGALTHFGTDWQLVERYLRIWHDVVSFDYADLTRSGPTYVCVVTRGQAEGFVVQSCLNCAAPIAWNGFTWHHDSPGRHTVCQWHPSMSPTDRVATPVDHNLRDITDAPAPVRKLPTGYDTMRFLLAGIGSTVVGTGLTLREILAGGDGVTLVYVCLDGHQVRDYLARRP